MSFEDSQPMNMKAQPTEGIFITTDQAKAVNVMIAAITVAQKAGAFSLKDSAHIYETLACFRTEVPQEEVSEEKEAS